MKAEYRFTCTLANGLHARPASLLAEVVRRFSAEVTLGRVGGAAVDARSVLSIVGLDVKQGDERVVIASGGDAPAAVAALRELIELRLEESEVQAAPATHELGAVEARLPIGLRKLNVAFAPGRPVCSGIGIGAAVVAQGLSLPAEAR